MSSKAKQSPGDVLAHIGASPGTVAKGQASPQGGMPDRIWFSCGLTLNLGNYESARVDAGMATDVRSGESLFDALLRCKDFVTHEIEGQSLDVRRVLHERTGEAPPASPNFKGGAPTKKGRKY
jgi:hypothetical protein